MPPRSCLIILTIPWSVIATSSLALTPTQVFEKVKDSVVVVKTLDANGKQSVLGSGVLMPSGKVGTNCHVVRDARSFQVGGGDRLVPATLWGGDEDRDICLLTAKGLDARPAVLGEAKHLKVGEPVYAVGAPKGLELSLSDGIVSQLRGAQAPLIQTTAAISPGSSGGAYRQVLQIDSANSNAWNSLGNTYFDLERYDEAIDAFRQALRIDSKDTYAWKMLGSTYFDLERYDKAIDVYRQVLRIDSKDTFAWGSIVRAYYLLGDNSAALEAIQRLRALDPAQADKLFDQIVPH